MAQNLSLQEQDELYEQYLKVKLDIEQAWLAFAPRNAKSRRNMYFCQVEQWNEEDRISIEIQNRIPYILDQIGSKINHLIGTQQSTRLDASVLAMERGDEAAASQLSKMVKWGEQMNRIEDIESTIFRDAAVKAAGVSQVRWKMKDIVNGYPSVEHIPLWQMVWDLATTEVDGSDIRWMARLQVQRQSSWIEQYPEYKDEIEMANVSYGNVVGSSCFNGIDIYDIMTERQYKETQSFGTMESIGRGGFLVGVEYYERNIVTDYVVVDAIKDEMLPFEDESEAYSYAEGLKEGYSQGGVLLMDERGNDLVYVSEVTKDCFYQTLIFGDKIAHKIEVDIPDFPYQIAYAYFDEGNYWSPVDSLIDPQILYNRLISEWDNQLGRANKDLATVVVPMLDNLTLDDVNASRSITGATIPVKDQNAIKIHQNLPASPDIPNMLNTAAEFMTTNVGGNNALGLQENAAESGKAVQYRQQAAGTAKLPLFDNLKRWRRKVTEMMVWYMKNYLDEAQVLRIKGKNGQTVEYIELDTGILDTIREMRTDILISEQSDTETSKQMQFATMMEVFKVAGDTIPAELKLMMMIKMGDMDTEIKEELLSGIEFYQSYQQQKMAMAEDEKLVSEVEKVVERQAIKGAVLAQLSAVNPDMSAQGGQNGSEG